MADAASPSAPPPDQFAAAVEQIRSSVKWLIAAFGAVGAILVAGVQLKDIGQLHGTALTNLIIWLAVGVGGVVVAVLAAARVLSPVDGSIQALESGPSMGAVRAKVNNDATLLQHQATSLSALLESYNQAIAANRAAWSKVSPSDSANASTRQDAAATQAKQQSLGATVGFLMRLGVYLRVQQLFNEAKFWMAVGAIAAAGGAVGVAYYAKPPKAATPAAAAGAKKPPVFIAPSLVHVSLTPAGRKTLLVQLGTECDLAQLRAVVVSGTTVRPEIITLPTDKCRALRLTLSRSVGVATATAG
jgi:hypothetical protein